MAFITRAEAKQKIEAILREQQPVKTGQTLPIRSGMTFNVYLIPVEYLAPNVLNDRIAWKIRELKLKKVEDYLQITRKMLNLYIN